MGEAIKLQYSISEAQAEELLIKVANNYLEDLNKNIEYFQNNLEQFNETANIDAQYSQPQFEAMFDFAYTSGLSVPAGENYNSRIDNEDYIIYYYLRHDLEGAREAVEYYDKDYDRRRINQMYLFFAGDYTFIDSGGTALEPHRIALGFGEDEE